MTLMFGVMSHKFPTQIGHVGNHVGNKSDELFQEDIPGRASDYVIAAAQN